MMLRDASLLPSAVHFHQNSLQSKRGNAAKSAMQSLAGALLFLALSQVGHAAPDNGLKVKRQDRPFTLTLWSPPPDGPPEYEAPTVEDIDWIHDKAQWELPVAPFVLPVSTLYTDGTFESDRDVFIDRGASLHTREGTRLHLSGNIANTADWHTRPGEYGLSKFGEGTLTLSGLNSYQDNTLLAEGILHVEGEQALGSPLNSLHMRRGATLSYGMDAIVYSPIQVGAGLPSEAGGPYADAVQLRVPDGHATQAHAVFSDAAIVKQGIGTLALAGLVHNTAPFIVNEGAVSVDQFIEGAVQVNGGARLMGNGSAGHTTLRSTAVLAPGAKNAPGMLAFTDDLVFEDGARFEVDVTPGGLSDFAYVMGKAELDGEVKALAQEGEWQASTRYTILAAEQGLNDSRFASASSNLAFLDPTLSYDANQVYLTLTRNDKSLDTVVETPTEDEVAELIEEEKPPVVPQPPEPPPTPSPEPEPTAPIEPAEPELPEAPAPETTSTPPAEEDAVAEAGPEPTLYDQIIVMDAPQAKKAFNQLSGSWAASLQGRIIEDSRFIREAALHNTALREPGAGGMQPGAWHYAYHSAAERSAYAGTPGDTRDLQGLVMGFARPLSAGWTGSVYGGAQRSRVQRQYAMADARLDSIHAGLAAARSWRGVDLAVGMAKTWHRIESHRSIGVAAMRYGLSSRSMASTQQFFAQLAAPLRWLAKPRSTSNVIPFARLAWVQHKADGFSEEGGAAALNVMPQHRSVLFSTLGLKLSHTLETAAGVAKVVGTIAWNHTRGDLRSFSDQSFRDSRVQTVFRSEGHAVARRSWTLKLGAEAPLAKNASLGLFYAGQFARRSQDHGARINLAWMF